MATITGKQLAEAMAGVPQWQRKGRIIRRTYEFKGLPEAIKFVSAVAKAAEKAWHHPDIDIRSNQVTLALTTHDEGGLTAKDFALAARADALGDGKRKA
jgi:4a-hydroxytetrahydrobiopterin dehydratase